MKLAKPKNEFEEKLLRNVEAHGYHLNFVKSSHDEPTYGYSIGLWETYGHPELIIVGLHHKPAVKIFEKVALDLASGGAHLMNEDIRDDFLPGFECNVISATPDLFKDYLLSAIWLYQGTDFPVLQIVYQDENNLWPWDDEASDQFVLNQPILGI